MVEAVDMASMKLSLLPMVVIKATVATAMERVVVKTMAMERVMAVARVVAKVAKVANPILTNPMLTNPMLTNPILTNPMLTNQTLMQALTEATVELWIILTCLCHTVHYPFFPHTSQFNSL
ncbi:uncharacterized protein DC041_0007502 [Schistosoma bovis]|uniref:Uncharacterized protein n=1 Tax=Schistosoma bovis TaxID=6184 RepID=A0A430QTP1_SCHBO|nr:uncharacterized protein DC041_0007502 [Schistosoma bovis]